MLLSDGFDNKGCDQGNPAKPSALAAATARPVNLPIYSCAMGPVSDQVLLGQLADVTGGQYRFMPTIDDLFEIYNYIRGQVTGDGVIVNESAMASVSQVSGWVDGCARRPLVAAVGSRERPATATSGSPSRNRSRVSGPSRWRPPARSIRATPSAASSDPRSGSRSMRRSWSRRAPRSTSKPLSPIAAPRCPVSGLRATGSVPRASITDLIDAHRDQLATIKLPRPQRPDGLLDPDQRQLAKLVLQRDQLRAQTGQDILAPVVVDVPMAPATVRPFAHRDGRFAVPAAARSNGDAVGSGLGGARSVARRAAGWLAA